MESPVASPEVKLSLHHLRLSIPLLALQVLGTYLVIETITSFLVMVFLVFQPPTEFLEIIYWWLGVAKSILELSIVLKIVLEWATVVYYIRDHQLVRFRGIFQIDEAIWELRSIKTVKLNQSWLGSLLGYGDIELTFSSSGYREDVLLRGLARARASEHILRLYLEEATDKKRLTDEEVPAVAVHP